MRLTKKLVRNKNKYFLAKYRFHLTKIMLPLVNLLLNSRYILAKIIKKKYYRADNRMWVKQKMNKKLSR